jgi:fatty-acyl-CoA synthase
MAGTAAMTVSRMAAAALRWSRWLGLDLLAPFYRFDRDIRRFTADHDTVPGLLAKRAAEHPHATMLVAPAADGSWTEWAFSDIDARVDAVAAGLIAAGVRPGSIVAVMMPSSPAFVVTWLAVSRAGSTAALLGPHLRGASLAHCLGACSATAAVIARAFACDCAVTDVVASAVGLNAPLWVVGDSVGDLCDTHSKGGCGGGGSSETDKHTDECGGGCGATTPHDARFRDLDELYHMHRDAKPPPLSREERKALHALMFTSGTTGMPKAVRISHVREASGGMLFGQVVGLNQLDRVYTPFGLHHGTGSLILSIALYKGCAVVLPHRFSAGG